ncbi:MAG: hypothetical protein ACYCZK_00620 [Microbacteriaceae bacterium]
MSSGSREGSLSAARRAAIAAGEEVVAAVQRHSARLAEGRPLDGRYEELEDRLWNAVAAYGEALDLLNDVDGQPAGEEPAPELRFTVRTRYDYTVVDERAFLADGQGIGAAVIALLEASASKPLSAFEVTSLETGSGLLTVHVNNEPLVAEDFRAADEPTDLLLVAPGEVLAAAREEPVFDSRAAAEAAAKQAGGV